MSMAVAEGERQIFHETPPDTRGSSSPLSATTFWLGILAVAAVLGGTVLVQLNYALSGRVMTRHCLDVGLSLENPGHLGVCNIVEGLRSFEEAILLYGGIVFAVAAMALGWGTQARMDTRRRREQAITGAILGLTAVVLAVVILYFRGGRPELFAKHFLNFEVVGGHFPGAFFSAMKNTVVLAFVGEIGGIVIGLILSILALSQRRAASRIPIRVIAIGLVDERADLAAASWRRVSDSVSHFVRQPHRNQLGIETKSLCFVVGHAGEVLQTHESNTATGHHELTGIRGADTDHENDIDVDVAFK